MPLGLGRSGWIGSRAKLGWLLSPELVSTSNATAEYGISNLYLAQHIRQAPGRQEHGPDREPRRGSD